MEPHPADAFLEDAAHYPGGHASGVSVPAKRGRGRRRSSQAPDAVLPIGAQSSLTGGATPMGELIVATSKMTRVVELSPDASRSKRG